MNINSIGPNKVISIYSANKKETVKETQKTTSDSIEISSLGKSLSNASISNEFELSPERLEKLKNEVQSGTYRPDAKLVAQKMLDSIKEREV